MMVIAETLIVMIGIIAKTVADGVWIDPRARRMTTEIHPMMNGFKGGEK
jgi:hypothetical protein